MPPPTATLAIDPRAVRATLDAVLDWARRERYLGHEKHDGLNSPLLFALAGWAKWPRLLAIQAVMRSPVNLRGLLGVRKQLNPKGLALFIRAYLDLHARDGDTAHLDEARRLAAMLLADQSGPGLKGRGWGYHYPWQDLAFYAPPRTPNAVVTAFVCDALLRLHEVTRQPELLDAVDAAVTFFLYDLPRLHETNAELCVGYMPMPMRMRVMDVSALVAVALARHARARGRPTHLGDAARLMAYVAGRQTADGAWYYTDPPEDSPVRIDNYHTGFIVDAMRDYMDLTGDASYRDAHARGLRFYAERLFNADGAPRWMSDQDFPHDVHGAAQGILTFAAHRAEFPGLADRIAAWSLRHLYSGRGWFHYQQRRGYTTSHTFMRWCNAWMARALAAWLATAPQAP
jgi:hypothetical protein